jgi:hypothetical protein
MTVDWGSLLTVVLVSAGATGAIVTLISLAVLGWSARSIQPVPAATSARRGLPSRRVGTNLATAALLAATAIVLLGLWGIVS